MVREMSAKQRCPEVEREKRKERRLKRLEEKEEDNPLKIFYFYLISFIAFQLIEMST